MFLSLKEDAAVLPAVSAVPREAQPPRPVAALMSEGAIKRDSNDQEVIGEAGSFAADFSPVSRGCPCPGAPQAAVGSEESVAVQGWAGRATRYCLAVQLQVAICSAIRPALFHWCRVGYMERETETSGGGKHKNYIARVSEFFPRRGNTTNCL